MASHKDFTNDELRGYFERWLKLRNRYHCLFIRKILKKYPHLSVSMIKNVAAGRAFDFEVLAAIEEIIKKDIADPLKRHKLVDTIGW